MSYRPKVRELIQALERLGCRAGPLRGGSHQKWTTPGGAALSVVIARPGAPVSRSVLTSVRRALRQEHLHLKLGPA
ncbi:type II toxin-antitoxin system HicA family toxin [Stigmatella sp. ncwal1]|uniref:Type II toxin-antitoxin system HicA family toxin n=1 Tax=Stigmatella ashevillensis TaxID=2995309 RepID=A0ABT5DFV4_9BACT|nr:type II toxin-antitoxin system HicA family toxin [Stigmatella ashevillena]MDC0711954.1 type II toxin-antitoxin system HicA family toxin [Stigmatella ashevillena]